LSAGPSADFFRSSKSVREDAADPPVHSALISDAALAAAGVLSATTPRNSPSRTMVTAGSACAAATSALESVAPIRGARTIRP
jgi:hypothetical protein